MMATKKKAPAKKTEPEDFNQGAFRIVQQATREKPAKGQSRKRPA
jgi:hypothetical protein